MEIKTVHSNWNWSTKVILYFDNIKCPYCSKELNIDAGDKGDRFKITVICSRCNKKFKLIVPAFLDNKY